MFLPLRDHNPTLRTPYVTIALIVTNVLVWIIELMQGDQSYFMAQWGATPYEITRLEDLVGTIPEIGLVHAPSPIPIPLTLFSSMFLHGGWLHIIMNMHFLWLFGNNVEDFLGHARFLAFYLATGLVGALAHVVVDPGSIIPMVGASGAISGIMGAYLVLYPRARFQSVIILFVFFTTVEIPAMVLLGVWMAIQVLGGLAGLGMSGGGGGVAFWAHIGGFAAGWIWIRVMGRGRLQHHHSRAAWRTIVPPPN